MRIEGGSISISEVLRTIPGKKEKKKLIGRTPTDSHGLPGNRDPRWGLRVVQDQGCVMGDMTDIMVHLVGRRPEGASPVWYNESNEKG